MARLATPGDLEKLISRFKIEELFDIVLPNIPSVSWPAIKKAIKRERMDLKMKVIAKFITRTVEIQGMNQKELNDLIAVLKLLELSRHSSRLKWNAYQLVGRAEGSSLIDDKELENALIRECRLSNIHAIVKVKTFKNLQWVSITVKKIIRGVGQRLQRPLTFAFAQDVLFLNMQAVQAKLMVAVKSALQYRGVRKSKLSGRKIESLLQCLMNKKYHSNEKKADFNGNAGTYKRIGPNFDFAQNEHRKKYAEYVFGKNPPMLEHITISTQDSVWRGNSLINSRHIKTLDSKVVYSSNDVYNMLKNMTELQSLVLPFPEFFKQIPNLGKNEIVVTSVTQRNM